ncbi:hypothetical protein LC605_20040 [Nostoc sp. CHAB 5836]|nr:hypothetical protein [Nostoc sp. CHAB 5836]
MTNDSLSQLALFASLYLSTKMLPTNPQNSLDQVLAAETSFLNYRFHPFLF